MKVMHPFLPLITLEELSAGGEVYLLVLAFATSSQGD